MRACVREKKEPNSRSMPFLFSPNMLSHSSFDTRRRKICIIDPSRSNVPKAQTSVKFGRTLEKKKRKKEIRRSNRFDRTNRNQRDRKPFVNVCVYVSVVCTFSSCYVLGLLDLRSLFPFYLFSLNFGFDTPHFRSFFPFTVVICFFFRKVRKLFSECSYLRGLTSKKYDRAIKYSGKKGAKPAPGL